MRVDHVEFLKKAYITMDENPPAIGLISLSAMDMMEEIEQSLIAKYITGSGLTPVSKRISAAEVPGFRPPREWKAVFLCHQSSHGRFSIRISDIISNQYDVLIPKLAEAYGNKSVCFIVCDVVEEITNRMRARQFEILKRDQPALIRHTSGNVFFCSEVGTIHEEDSTKIKNIINEICEDWRKRQEEISRLKQDARYSNDQRFETLNGSRKPPIPAKPAIRLSRWV
ncbi:uncharacterized protein LOC121417574 [Lytechinus variegatus]|uniref:uncharacterized protein LOC121417574 n=1 Tax=Lytechinus variegatus TaxID=7654 RepID=UPI001BB25791|nr:uncharacterized protein LOC121417574 [Lytechinus variegatus]